MGPRYLFYKALNLLNAFASERKRVLENHCLRIAESQKSLLGKADKEMIFCTETCRGLCCKNLNPDTLFTLWDFIFILVINPDTESLIAEQLEDMPLQSPSPCPFLRDGEGPCLFPVFVKPQLCVTTFCGSEERIKEEIRRVNRDFYRLCFAVQKARVANLVQRGIRLR